MKITKLLTVVVLALLVTVLSVSAQVKLLAPLNAWDRDAAKWENGNVQLWADPNVWVPFYEELNFDGADFDTTGYPNSCVGPDMSTPLAGELEIGLYHTDNSPSGAMGFQATRNWMLLDCAVVDALIDPIASPPTTPLSATLSRINGQDTVESTLCGGNCTDEIVNRFFVNLDADCDGAPDAGLPARVCLYWEAQPPDVPTLQVPAWTGNIQARINSIVDGVSVGDKTLNFSMYGPSAVELRTLDAGRTIPGWLVAAIVIAFLLGMAVLVRRHTEVAR